MQTPLNLKSGRKKIEEEKKEEVFSINTTHAKMERYTLREICRQYGWKEIRNSLSGNLLWYIGPLRDIDLQILSYKKCIYNRYPKSNLICRKRQFHLLIRKYERFFPDEYNFIPRTYILPEEYKSMVRHYNSHPEKVFLSKPSKGKGGEGIFFIKTQHEIPKRAVKHFEYVVQEYVPNPLLINNK